MKHKACYRKVATILLALGLLAGVCSEALAQGKDEDYQFLYDELEKRQWHIPTLAEVEEKYGSMNADYYEIVLLENQLYLMGNTDIVFTDAVMISSVLERDEAFPLAVRKNLREDVEKYGLNCQLPNDLDFIEGTAETPVPTREPSIGSVGYTEEELEEMASAPVIVPEPTPSTTPTTSPTEELQYADVAPDAWYYEAVTAMSEGGLFKGYDDGLFHPNDNITYGQWAMLMSRIAIDNYSYQMKPGDHWAQEAYSRTSRDGICQDPNMNYGETLDSLYNRAQAISRVYRLAHGDKFGLEYRLQSKYTGKIWTFEDIPDGELVKRRYTWCEDESDWYSSSTGRWVDTWVLDAYNLGITHGIDASGTCNPTAPITRAEVAQLLYNMGITQEKQCDLRVGGIGS